jgi:large subunit ribosomal protein L32
MAQPKYKTRRSHTRSRKASCFYARAERVALGRCPRCHTIKPSHYACPSCGYYAGEQVYVVKAREKEEEAE